MGEGKKVTIVTHNGTFHPDDVFAVAVLKKLAEDEGKEVEIVRTRDGEIIKAADYVVDVGGIYDSEKERYDHHQEGWDVARENGVCYSSSGLVWKKYGEKFCQSKEIADSIDKILIQSIDAIDNGIEIAEPKIEGVYHYTMLEVILSFRPSWNESMQNYTTAFRKAVIFAESILEREVVQAKGEIEAKIRVDQDFKDAEDKRIVYLNGRYPWRKAILPHKEVLFLVYRANDEMWRVRCIRDNIQSFNYRKLLPKSWAGKKNKDLAALTGVEGAAFCHDHRFVAAARSKEAAMELAKLAVEAKGD